MLSYFVPAYPLGVLADRCSKRKLLAAGLAINATGFLLLAWSRNYGEAIAAIILSGVGGSAFHPAATALIARLYPEATGKALGFLGIGASAGFFVGPAYAGWRGSVAGWRAPVFELGLAGILMALLFYRLADEEAAPEKPLRFEPHHDKLFPTPLLWTLFIMAAFAFSMRDFTGSSMGSLGSLFLQKAHGLDPGATGRILSTIFLASAVSNPLFGKLSDKGVVKWTTFALGTAAAVVLAFPHFPVRFA